MSLCWQLTSVRDNPLCLSIFFVAHFFVRKFSCWNLQNLSHKRVHLRSCAWLVCAKVSVESQCDVCLSKREIFVSCPTQSKTKEKRFQHQWCLFTLSIHVLCQWCFLLYHMFKARFVCASYSECVTMLLADPKIQLDVPVSDLLTRTHVWQIVQYIYIFWLMAVSCEDCHFLLLLSFFSFFSGRTSSVILRCTPRRGRVTLRQSGFFLPKVSVWCTPAMLVNSLGKMLTICRWIALEP